MVDKRWVTINTSISADGLGTPVVSLYFSYCDKKDKTGSFCPLCHNKELQKDGIGFLLSFEEIIELIDGKLNSMEKLLGREIGVCFLGGEPLAEINRDMIMKLSGYYKGRFQITYSWRMPDEIDGEWIKYIDKIVCGEYIDGLNIGDEYELGSSNQVVIDGEKKIILEYKGEVIG